MKTKTIIHFFQLFLITESLVDAMKIRRIFKKREFHRRKFSQCYCGESNPLATRIVGGKRTKPDHIPWQALIMVDHLLSCGGSVISDRYILTAGHCVVNIATSRMSVYLGVYDRVNMNRGTERKYKVIKGTLHPKFAASPDNGHDLRDIALLKVDKQIKFSVHIKPVCLANKGTSFDGKLAEISGWGTTKYEGSASNILLEANVRVLSDKRCLKSKLGDHVAEDVESQFCAYGVRKDGCQGDSGGPLVFRSSKGVMTQIGVISWGDGCGLIGYPGVYTRLSEFQDWIRKNTKDSTYCIPKK